MEFKACISRSACTEDGTHCRACGRSHEEIIRTRLLVNSLTAFIQEAGYDNRDDFLEYLVKKVNKKLAHRELAD